MTIAELITKLQEYPPDTPVKVFSPFDGNGPWTWETPSFYMESGEIRIDSR
jgi:hypothetical protein